MKTLAVLPVLLLLAACEALRTTTVDERAIAEQTLVTVGTALLAAKAADKISDEDFTLAMAQLAELRADVAASAETPVSWPVVYQRILNFGLQWAMQEEG